MARNDDGAFQQPACTGEVFWAFTVISLCFLPVADRQCQISIHKNTRTVACLIVSMRVPQK